ncbi:MAG: twin-arginine translocase subunit TatC [Planctomycetales bacterium]|nr:twin-arginine translocase subunit TatC [Planctomycetales bacterium]NIM07609.1 twin-arginine translocase subunit TatC [Planctomycetales bacterium]NIN07115.1 twin-arginine translocase subunit TatC [Planctomycetales bacterium]NIN76209.1 twin-arginine translocase subunit TatC [Planctomycetales bacterium]NIO33431.1 twin-arginine translocase subunit TatC [Planctomycetales bacterium]
MMALQTDEDLFQESTMTFGEHLEELRSCLIKALLWLLVGFAIGLLLGDWMVAAIQGPLETSLQTHYQKGAKRDYERFAAEQREANQPLPYPVEEMNRLINSGYTFDKYLVHPAAVRRQLEIDNAPEPTSHAAPRPPDSERALQEELVPLFVWRKSTQDPRVSVSALNPTEAFMIWLKASLVVGIVLASPMIFYHLWSFVAAGLYPHEKKYVHVFLPFSVVLFLGGALFCFFVVFRFILDFLFTFNADLGIQLAPRITEWLSFAIILPIGFGISFQLPLVMLFLERIGIFDVPAYMAKWRIAVLIIAVASMLLTPADPISMLAMAIPLTGLYFLGIALCRYLPKQQSMLER